MKEVGGGCFPWSGIFFRVERRESLFLDNVMWTISGRLVWIPLYLFILFLFSTVATEKGILAALF